MGANYAPDLSTKQLPLLIWSAVFGAKVMSSATHPDRGG